MVCGGLGLDFFAAAGEVVGPLFFCVTDLAVVSKSRVVFPVWCEYPTQHCLQTRRSPQPGQPNLELLHKALTWSDLSVLPADLFTSEKCE